MAAVPGTIGGYEVRGVLGRGATGTVYLGYQPLLERRAAIKELGAELTADPAFRERFRAEAEVMARLDDDHCVRVYELIQGEAHDYLVSELVEGASLRAVLQQAGRLNPEEALGTAKGALLGLARAHSLGLLHRDIKPENILVDAEGTSKLADFGLAVATSGPGAAGGMPAGSPAYMSPEMVAGGVVDARSDLYSAGAVLFELMTGRPPFLADSPLAVMRMHREAPVPDPRALDPGLGTGLAAFLMRLLAKDPQYRPQSAGEMLSILEALAAEAYGADWESRSSLKRRVAEAVDAGLGLLALLSAAGTAAAAGAVGSALTAEGVYAAGAGTAAGGVLGLSWAVIAGIVGVVLAGGGIALAAAAGVGPFARGNPPAPIATPSPTPSVVLSPSPSASPSPSPSESPSPSPSPSPSASPSPSPSPTPTHAGLPTPTPSPSQAQAPPGPIAVSNASLWYATCPSGACGAPTQLTAADPRANPNSAPGSLAINCTTDSLRFWEQYDWSYPGSPGTSTPVTVNWTGTGGAGAINDSHPSQAVSSGGSGSHPYTASAAENPPVSPGGPGTFNITFRLTWTNPGGQPGSTASPLTFYWICG